MPQDQKQAWLGHFIRYPGHDPWLYHLIAKGIIIFLNANGIKRPPEADSDAPPKPPDRLGFFISDVAPFLKDTIWDDRPTPEQMQQMWDEYYSYGALQAVLELAKD